MQVGNNNKEPTQFCARCGDFPKFGKFNRKGFCKICDSRLITKAQPRPRVFRFLVYNGILVVVFYLLLLRAAGEIEHRWWCLILIVSGPFSLLLSEGKMAIELVVIGGTLASAMILPLFRDDKLLSYVARIASFIWFSLGLILLDG